MSKDANYLKLQLLRAETQLKNLSPLDYLRQSRATSTQIMGIGAGTPGPAVTDPNWRTHYDRIMKAQMLQQEIMLREAERQRELASATAYVTHQAYMLREALLTDLMGRQ